MAVTFVFSGKGDDRSLSPASTSSPQAAASAASRHRRRRGLGLSRRIHHRHDRHEFRRFRDLSLTTMMAANNSGARYWVYRPRSRDFTPLVVTGDGGGCADYSLAPAGDHQLLCHSTARPWNISIICTRSRATTPSPCARRYKRTKTANRSSTEFDLSGHAEQANQPHRRRLYRRQPSAHRISAQARRRGGVAPPPRIARATKGRRRRAYAALRGQIPGGARHHRRQELCRRTPTITASISKKPAMPQQAIDVLEAVIGTSTPTAPPPISTWPTRNSPRARWRLRPGKNYAEYAKRMTDSGKAAKIPPRVADRMK